MGRKRNDIPTVTQSFRIPITVKAALQAEAYRKRTEVGALVRLILQDHLEQDTQAPSIK